VIIRDDAIGAVVTDEIVDRPSHEVDWRQLDPTHPHRYIVLRRGEAGWQRLYEHYRGLNPPVDLIVTDRPARAVTAPGDQADLSGKLLFLFTVDTEPKLRRMRQPDYSNVIDDHIFGRTPDGPAGIERQMDLLEAFGFRGTFFLDILLELQCGAAALERVIATISERGHDIQLHLEPDPNFLYHRDPEVRRLCTVLERDDKDLFRRALDISIRLFERRVGRRPVAYRSSAYHLSDGYLEALGEAGIAIDTSLYAFKNCRVSPWMQSRTQPFFVGDVLEVPVSWTIVDSKAGPTPRQMAPAKVGAHHAAFTRQPAPVDMPATLVYLSHSFSLLTKTDDSVTEGDHNAWRARFTEITPTHVLETLGDEAPTPLPFYLQQEDPDRLTIMAQSLRALASRDDVVGMTYQQLYDAGGDRWRLPRAAPVDPVPVWDNARGRQQRTPVYTDLHGRASTTAARVYSTDRLAYCEHRGAEPTDSPLLGDDGFLEHLLGLLEETTGRFLTILGPYASGEVDGLASLAGVESLETVVVQSQDPDELAGEILRRVQDLPYAPDVIVCPNTLAGLRPQVVVDVLAALGDAIALGGRCLVTARTVGTPRATGLTTPYAHLLFSRSALAEASGGKAVLPANPLCAATYLLAMRRAGFEFEHIARSLADGDARSLTEHRAKLAACDQKELRTTLFGAILRRPETGPLYPAGLSLVGEKSDDRRREGFRDLRRAWPHAREKQTREWGERRAVSLWSNLYRRWAPDLTGLCVLDLGCSWGYLLKLLLETERPRRLIGVDIEPLWDTADHGWDWRAEGDLLEFHATGLVDAPIEEKSVDVLFCSGVLHMLPPDELQIMLDRAFDLIRPGGQAIIRTRVFTSFMGADLHRDFDTPFPHLLNGKRDLDARLAERGAESPYTNWFSATTYVCMYLQAGFEVLTARRRENQYVPELTTRLATDFHGVSPDELHCHELLVRLVRPLEAADLVAISGR